MKKLSTSLLANLVATKRKELKLTQQDLADATGINRAQISRLEKEDYLPSIPQLEQLGETLGFEPDEVFVDNHDSESSLHDQNGTNSYWRIVTVLVNTVEPNTIPRNTTNANTAAA